MKVIKIGAAWCNACNVMRPRWNEIEKANPWLETEYIEYDDEPQRVAELQITEDVVPVFIFMDSKGNEIERHSGELTKKKIIDIITRLKDK